MTTNISGKTRSICKMSLKSLRPERTRRRALSVGDDHLMAHNPYPPLPISYQRHHCTSSFQFDIRWRIRKDTRIIGVTLPRVSDNLMGRLENRRHPMTRFLITEGTGGGEGKKRDGLTDKLIVEHRLELMARAHGARIWRVFEEKNKFEGVSKLSGNSKI